MDDKERQETIWLQDNCRDDDDDSDVHEYVITHHYESNTITIDGPDTGTANGVLASAFDNIMDNDDLGPPEPGDEYEQRGLSRRDFM